MARYADQAVRAVVDEAKPLGGRQGGDTCATATVIASLPYTATGSNVGFTDDYEEQCNYSSTSGDVVYSYTPTADDTIDLTLCVGDTDYDTKMFVYENTCVSPYYACNDDSCSAPYYSDYVSSISGMAVTAYNTYYIVVDGYGGVEGTYTLEVTGGGTVDPGEDCSNPWVIASLPYTDTNVTTGRVNNYEEACPYSSTSPDVVYAYTPLADDNIDITLCVGYTDYDTKMFVYENTCASPYYACNDDSCSSPYYSSYVSQIPLMAVTAGNTYYIVVDGYGGGSGTYTLEVTGGGVFDPYYDCPVDSIFSQGGHGPDDSWSCSRSEETGGYLVADDFTGLADPICDLHFWGLTLYHNGSSWVSCTMDPVTFNVFFYDDNPSTTGVVVCEYLDVPAVATDTGDLFSIYPMYEFVINLDPCCTLPSGWVGIQSTDANPSCWLLWDSSAAPSAGATSLQFNGTSWTDTGFQRGFCLTATGVSFTGACCDDSTGVCQDDVLFSECPPGSRFAMNTLCADLVPPCGEGACCNPLTGECQVTSELICVSLYGPGNFIPGVTCDPNPCPCVVLCPPGALDEGEPCGDDTNGGCNMDPGFEIFTPLACDDVYCGLSFADGTTRDTDWFEIVLTDYQTVTFTVEAEFTVIAGFLESTNPGSGDCADLTGYLEPYATGTECQEIAVQAMLGPGTHWLFVAPSVYSGYPCSTGPYDYVASLTCEPVTSGACCSPIDSTCTVTDLAGCIALYGSADYWLPGEVCDPNPCPMEGDNCMLPFTLTLPADLPVSDAGTTCGADNDYANTCLGYYDGGEDVIYEITVTTPTAFQITLDPGTYTWTGICIDDSCPPDDSCIALSTLSSAAPHSLPCMTFPAGTYYVMIDTWPSPTCFDYTLIIDVCEPCTVECPMGALLEGETCGDATNDGCNMDPGTETFIPINCGEVYCGTAYADGDTRDTDWYEVVITEPQLFTWNVEAEFAVILGLAATSPAGSGDCADLTGSLAPYTTAAACTPASVQYAALPGTYWFFVAPSVFSGYSCSWGPWDYTAELVCDPITDGACCDPATGACSVTDYATCV
ncbi:hypothetical protein JW905_13055, partial [bacterium]|nr:hypothetical protein [candidate division CSSED10-310 bacterium]